MSLANIAGALRTVLDELVQARRGLASCVSSTTSVRDQVAIIAQDSQRPTLDHATAELTSGARVMGEADALIASAMVDIAEYGRRLGVGPISSQAPAATTHVVPLQPATPRRPPSWVRKAAGRLPDRPGNDGPTSGLAFDDQGRPLSDQPFTSGRNVASTKDLRPLPGLKGWPWTLTDHVESVVAERMRRPGAPRNIDLVVNKSPCTDDPYGCDRVLRHIIPEGSRLTVYVVDPTARDGVTLYRAYVGTGKGILR